MKVGLVGKEAELRKEEEGGETEGEGEKMDCLQDLVLEEKLEVERSVALAATVYVETPLSGHPSSFLPQTWVGISDFYRYSCFV